jgi:hypothetical protein
MRPLFSTIFFGLAGLNDLIGAGGLIRLAMLKRAFGSGPNGLRK